MTSTVDRPIETLAPRRCPKCGAEGSGRYCERCGSSLGRPRDLSFKYFLKEVFVAVTDVDSALIASFRSLLTKPGQLTVEYLDGDRQRFMAPFRIFLLSNLLYFLAVAEYGVGVFTAPLRVQTQQMAYSMVSEKIVRMRLHSDAPIATVEQKAARDSARQVFAAKYDGATESVGKAIIVVLIPLYALVFSLLYAGHRHYYAEHLILSTHLISFLMITIAALGTAAGLIGGMAHRFAIGGSRSDETVYSVLLFSAYGTYTYKMQRVVYGATKAGAGVRTGVLMISIIPILVAFKFVLFLVTLYWIG